MRIGLLFLVHLLWACTAGAAEPVERVLKVPVKIEDSFRKKIERDITVTVWEEQGRLSYPLLLVSHGRPPNKAGRENFGRARYPEASKYFASLGYSVWVPTRIGYGVSGPDEDPENSGPCSAKVYPPVYAVAVEQVLQVIDYAKRRADIDGTKIVAVGQSVGGAATIALAARNPPGLLAAVNFAGGGGGNPDTSPGEPCEPHRLTEMFAAYGKTARVPTLWIYTENDRYFAPKHSRGWHQAFRAQGATGEFVLLPAFGQDGHLLFVRGFAIWKPIVEPFLPRSL